jgi:PAS domain S-box-containing protein
MPKDAMQSDLPGRPLAECKTQSGTLKSMRKVLRKANDTIEKRVTECTAQLADRERRIRALLDALPAAIYTTDVAGRITYYNQAAADLAGRRPVLGSDEWCVTWRLCWPDGRPMRHDECPMAVALKENRPVRGEEALAERPDGTRVPFIPYPTPLHDESGALIGAVNMLVDISERKHAEESLREREQALSRAHAELEARAAELTRFNKAAVGREMRIIELKEEVNALCERLGERARHPLELDPEPQSPPAPSRPASAGLVPLDAILRTQQLGERPARPPDYESESRALAALVQALTDSPHTILQALADKVLEVLGAGSAGLSLLTQDGDRF